LTNFDRLRASGLPTTWRTILVGWEIRLAFTDDVQAYAADRLGREEEDQPDLVFRLFDADPADTAEVGRVLQALADRDGGDYGSIDRAQRTWNLALLKDLLSQFSDSPSRNDIADLLDTITDPIFYLPFDVSHRPDIDPELASDLNPFDSTFGQRYYGRVLEWLRTWAESEGAFLRRSEG
jgi:hypothetical protein